MNILLLGNGGREHAFAWKLSQSPLCQRLFIAPGNAGTQANGTNVAIDPTDFTSLKAFVVENQVRMVVVGPEEPLVRGIYDAFQNEPGLEEVLVIGASRKAAQLEGSKAFAKKFMQEFDIPTAAYREFTTETLQEGLAFVATQTAPIVLKADGLAAGKGVLICKSVQEAQTELKAMLGGKFGEASKTVLVEQFLEGIEFSVFVITDGRSFQILPSAKDYKRVGEGDTGLNTGGMGAISPVPFLDVDLLKKVRKTIIEPTIKGLEKRGMVYHGFIFFGLILVNNEPYLIEYNCRMGDPEAAVVLPRITNDLVKILLSVGEKRVHATKIRQSKQAAATVVLASGGYPNEYQKGKTITGLNKIKDALVFHAGTTSNGEQTVTNGGRVLTLTAFGGDLKQAVAASNQNAAMIEFEGKYYRRDIGFEFK